MTKEELEKEADKWLENNLHSTEEDYKQAYLAGAESREKQIDELEEVRSKQAELINKDTIRMENQKYQIEKLEKENAELKADNDARKFAMAMSGKVEKQLREENTELKEQNRNYEQLIDNWSVTLVKERLKNYKQLTKAKELIKTLLLIADNKVSQMEFQICVADAKQFLNSEVEKK